MPSSPDPTVADSTLIDRVLPVRLSETAQNQFQILAPQFADGVFGIVETLSNGNHRARPLSIGDDGRRTWLSDETFAVFADEALPAR